MVRHPTSFYHRWLLGWNRGDHRRTGPERNRRREIGALHSAAASRSVAHAVARVRRFMPDPAPSRTTDPPARPLSNAQILRRLFGLAWQYRHDCLAVLAHQAALLALGLAGLGVVGLAVDVIRSALDPSAAPPPWPLGLRPPAQVGPDGDGADPGGAGAGDGRAAQRGQLPLLGGGGAAAPGGRGAPAARRGVRQAPAAGLPLLRQQRLGVDHQPGHRRRAVAALVHRRRADPERDPDAVAGGVPGLHGGQAPAADRWPAWPSTPLLWLGTMLFSRWVQPAYAENRRLADNLVLALSEGVQGIQVVRGFGGEPHELVRFQARNRQLRDQQRRIFWRVSLFSPGVSLMGQLNIVVLLFYGGWIVRGGRAVAGRSDRVRRPAAAVLRAGDQPGHGGEHAPAEPDRRPPGVRGDGRAGGGAEPARRRRGPRGWRGRCGSRTCTSPTRRTSRC